MDWSDLGKIVTPLAPVLGGILGGPAGSAAGSVVGGILGKALGTEPTPDAIAGAMQADPAAAGQVVSQVEADHGASLAEMEARMLDTINATMREELKSEHWVAWAWRPVFGLAFAFVWTMHGTAIGLALWVRDYSVVARIPDLTIFYGVAAAVVGVSAWGRTKEKLAGVAGPLSTIVDVVSKAVKK